MGTTAHRGDWDHALPVCKRARRPDVLRAQGLCAQARDDAARETC
ncbi:hypothetical protein [Caulobacter soli]|nr:hypothetical protein [Caulobacter soli]